MDFKIEIACDEKGMPVLKDADPSERIDLSTSQEAASGITDVRILGDKASLLRLAEILVAVAHMPDFHVHMESGRVGNPLNCHPTGCRLTIGNIEKRQFAPRANGQCPIGRAVDVIVEALL